MSMLKEVVLRIEVFMAPYLYSACRLIFGTLYPAYASYKAVRTKNVREYVKWMMYWIVFALFITVETFSDVFLSWLPFYYEMKIVFVIWLLSPLTRGSSFLFRKFVHPQLIRREKDIDVMIAHARKQGYATLVNFGQRGLSYASNVILSTAIKGQSSLVNHIRKSYSMSDINAPDQLDNVQGIESDEDELDNRIAEDNRELDQRRDGRSRSKDKDRLYGEPDHDSYIISDDLGDENDEDIYMEAENGHHNYESKLKRSNTIPGLYSVAEEPEFEESVIRKEAAAGIRFVSRPSATSRYGTRSNAYSSSERKQIEKYGTLPKQKTRKRAASKKSTGTTHTE